MTSVFVCGIETDLVLVWVSNWLVFVRGSKLTSFLCAGWKLLGSNVWIEIDLFFVCESNMIFFCVGMDWISFCVAISHTDIKSISTTHTQDNFDAHTKPSSARRLSQWLYSLKGQIRRFPLLCASWYILTWFQYGGSNLTWFQCSDWNWLDVWGWKWLGFSVWIEINLVFVSNHQNWLEFKVGIEIELISVEGWN